MAITAADVERAIRGIDFPADRNDLIQQAKTNRANTDIIGIIENLPKNEFKSPIDVSKAFGEERRNHRSQIHH